MAEKAAKADSNAEAKVVKLLLLGAEDSGKSTICKAVKTICGDGYSEAEQDVLRSRERTTSIVTTDFKIKGLDFAMHDVGSLRNERRKWMHAFDDVNAVIFVADLSGFDEVLCEDESRNRMEEAIDLFDQIVNSRWFAETSMILFLNKKDLFEEKIAKASISKHFCDYDGDDNDFKAGSEFFKQKFLGKSKNKSKSIYPLVTCATETTNVAFVFNISKAIILEQNMKSAGLD